MGSEPLYKPASFPSLPFPWTPAFDNSRCHGKYQSRWVAGKVLTRRSSSWWRSGLRYYRRMSVPGSITTSRFRDSSHHCEPLRGPAFHSTDRPFHSPVGDICLRNSSIFSSPRGPCAINRTKIEIPFMWAQSQVPRILTSSFPRTLSRLSIRRPLKVETLVLASKLSVMAKQNILMLLDVGNGPKIPTRSVTRGSRAGNRCIWLVSFRNFVLFLEQGAHRLIIVAITAAICGQFKCLLRLAYILFCPRFHTFSQWRVRLSRLRLSTSIITIWILYSPPAGSQWTTPSSVSTNRLLLQSFLETILLQNPFVLWASRTYIIVIVTVVPSNIYTPYWLPRSFQLP